jgi:hypothetical protein
VVLAFTTTAVGFAFDAGSGSRELSFVFSACYVVGCLLAVLAVRQSSIFTAVIQPPLLLFVTVPGAYFLFHGSEINGLKDLAINCGYPLIERFPLMFFTSAAVLLIGMARWYLGMSSRRTAAVAAPATSKAKTRGKTKQAAPAGGLVAGLKHKVSGLLAAPAVADDEEGDEPPRRTRTSERPRRTASSTDRARTGRDGGRETARGAAARKPAKRSSTPSRSRHNRPPETEIIEPVVDRPRRSRPTSRTPETPEEPRRRSRAQTPREGREPREPREPRKQPPRERRSTYDRPERRRRPDDREPYEPLEPHTRNGSSSSHHPISRVRYRGEDGEDERAEYRSPPRARRSWEADAWEYDV